MALEKKYGEQIRFIVVDVNTEQGYKLAEDFNIRFLPTMLFLDQNGDMVKQLEGWIDGAVLEDRLVSLLDRE